MEVAALVIAVFFACVQMGVLSSYPILPLKGNSHIPVKLYYCSGDSVVAMWHVLEPMECTQTDNSELNLTIYFPDISDVQISSCECLKNIDSPLRAKLAVPIQMEKPSIVTFTNCRDIDSEGKSMHGLQIQTVDDCLFSMGQCGESAKKNAPHLTNYQFNFRISVNKYDGAVTTSSMVFRTCSSASEVCPTDNGVLIWKHNSMNLPHPTEQVSAICRLTSQPYTASNATVMMTPPPESTTIYPTRLKYGSVKYRKKHQKQPKPQTKVNPSPSKPDEIKSTFIGTWYVVVFTLFIICVVVVSIMLISYQLRNKSVKKDTLQLTLRRPPYHSPDMYY